MTSSKKGASKAAPKGVVPGAALTRARHKSAPVAAAGKHVLSGEQQGARAADQTAAAGARPGQVVRSGENNDSLAPAAAGNGVSTGAEVSAGADATGSPAPGSDAGALE